MISDCQGVRNKTNLHCAVNPRGFHVERRIAFNVKGGVTKVETTSDNPSRRNAGIWKVQRSMHALTRNEWATMYGESKPEHGTCPYPRIVFFAWDPRCTLSPTFLATQRSQRLRRLDVIQLALSSDAVVAPPGNGWWFAVEIGVIEGSLMVETLNASSV